MIINIPEPDDFFIAGWRFLDYGWSQAMDLLIEADSQQISGDGYQTDSNDMQEFWELGRPNLVTSLALVQQGIELLMKGCIAEISPYLLIAEPRSYPNKCDKRNASFSEFRTIDAQDLIKIYDTVREKRLSEDFKRRINELRQHRNMAFHNVNNFIYVEASQVLIAVFEAIENLNNGKNWLKIHKGFFERMPASSFDYIGYYTNPI